jgi:uncharacterized protein (TIGR00251 family)
MSSRNIKGDFSNPSGGAAITVRVVTRAVKSEIVGAQEDGTIKVRIKAAPAGSDEANEELLNFLAQELGVSAKSLEIVAGAGKRDKLITVEGLSASQVEAIFG